MPLYEIIALSIRPKKLLFNTGCSRIVLINVNTVEYFGVLYQKGRKVFGFYILSAMLKIVFP